jgi:asparagine synthetase B (glutamine-hydrolysing)
LLVEILISIIIEEFFAIRKELEQRNPDVIFTTDSDCEILLHLYKEHGPDFLSKVRQVLCQNP